MKYSSVLSKTLLSGALALVGLAAHAQWTEWTDAYAPYPNPVFTPDQILQGHGSGVQYMWYCSKSDNCPSGTESPYVAEFKLAVNLPPGGVDSAIFKVLADDYFSLYVNGQLADSCAAISADPLNPCDGRTTHGAYGWLVNTDPLPPTPFLVDLQPYLKPGANEIFVFACNAESAANMGVPGATPSAAPGGCPVPGPNLYQYLLMAGTIVGFDNSQDGDFYQKYIYSSSALDGDLPWQARALPEPASGALLGLGLACIAGLRRRGATDKNHGIHRLDSSRGTLSPCN